MGDTVMDGMDMAEEWVVDITNDLVVATEDTTGHAELDGGRERAKDIHYAVG